MASLKTGRARPTPSRIVWHDTADAALAGKGLALSEQRGLWRLERLRPEAEPGAQAWPPGAPPPLLAEGPDAAMLDAAMPAPLMPCAAFDGKALTLRLAVPDAAAPMQVMPAPEAGMGETEPVAEAPVPAEPLPELGLTVLQGVLRSVTGEHEVARLHLHGPTAPAIGLLFALADEVDIAAPRASLAAEALAAARNQTVPARRLGPPALTPGGSVAEAFAQVTGHLADVILYWAPLTAADTPGLEPVHQMRVAVRRLRSAMTLFRAAADSPWWQQAQAGLKTLSGLLGPARDWDVFATGTGYRVSTTFPDERAIARLLLAAERRRASSYTALREFLQQPAFRRLGLVLAVLSVADAWQHTATAEQQEVLRAPLDDFAGRLLDRRLKQVMRAGEAIDTLPPEALHDLRLRGKRLRYAAEVFAPLFGGRDVGRFIRRLTRLQEHLGTLNDDSVATALLAELNGQAAERAFAIGVVRGFMAAGHGQNRAAMYRSWKKFRRQEPFWR